MLKLKTLFQIFLDFRDIEPKRLLSRLSSTENSTNIQLQVLCDFVGVFEGTIRVSRDLC